MMIMSIHNQPEPKLIPHVYLARQCMQHFVSSRRVGFSARNIVVPSVIHVAGTHLTQAPLNLNAMACHSFKRT